MGESVTTRDSFPRRKAGMPVLGRARVFLAGIMERGEVLTIPDRLRQSDFPMGATTTVVEFPGDPDPIAWDFQHHERAPARPRIGRGLLVPAPEPQTVSNLRRAELAGLDQVPEAHLDIFEGIA